MTVWKSLIIIDKRESTYRIFGLKNIYQNISFKTLINQYLKGN